MPQEISPNRRKAVYTEGAGPVYKCTGQCTVEGSVQGGGVDTGGAKLRFLLLGEIS